MEEEVWRKETLSIMEGQNTLKMVAGKAVLLQQEDYFLVYKPASSLCPFKALKSNMFQ